MFGGNWLFDLDGNSITPLEYAVLMEDESKYRIAQDDIGGYWISTVYIGVSFYTPPLIFETMIFDQIAGAAVGTQFDLAQMRYATIAEARAGHIVICEFVRNAIKVGRL